MTPRCDDCQRVSEMRTGKELGMHRKSHSRKYYVCLGCGAKVGCHPSTDIPLGTLANKNLAQLRQDVHYAFDRLWLNKTTARLLAYYWLRKEMGLKDKETHIGMFDEEKCLRAIELAKNFEDLELV